MGSNKYLHNRNSYMYFFFDVLRISTYHSIAKRGVLGPLVDFAAEPASSYFWRLFWLLSRSPSLPSALRGTLGVIGSASNASVTGGRDTWTVASTVLGS